MLKVKDNVDLKELEKFGFYEIKFGYTNKCRYETSKICVYKEDRYIDFRSEWYGSDFELMNLIFDLIQAGLVEKVGE